MIDGSMYHTLMNYSDRFEGDLDYYRDHSVLTFNTPDEDAQWKVISVFKTSTLYAHGEFFNYMQGEFTSDAEFMNFVYNVRIRSMFNVPVTVNENDQLLTLSTCSYEFTNFRTVIVARKVRIGESAKVDVKKATLNGNAVWPQVYYNARGGTRPKLTDFSTAYLAKEIKWYDGKFRFRNQKVQETDGHGTTAPPTTKAATTAGSSSTAAGTTRGANSARASTSAATKATTKPVVYCNVKFINYDGSTISVQKVEYGKAAVKPQDPVKPSD